MIPLLIALTENQIGAAGVTQLADALQRNSTLTTLDLGGKHDIIYADVPFMITIFIASCSFSFRFVYLFFASLFVIHPSSIVSHICGLFIFTVILFCVLIIIN